MHFDYLLVAALILFVLVFYASPYEFKTLEDDDDE
jgi:hypothetical protein